MEAYEAGVARQAKALGVDLHIFQGKQDAALQREQIEQAISLGVQSLIVSHGQPESLKDVVQKAVAGKRHVQSQCVICHLSFCPP